MSSAYELAVREHSQRIPELETDEDLGLMPVHRAVIRDADVATFRLLVQGDPESLNRRDSTGRNVLHLAMRNMITTELMMAILESIHPNELMAKERYERTPIEIGIQFHAPTRLFDCLLPACPETTGGERRALRLHIAMEHRCNEDTVRRLLQSNPSAAWHLDSLNRTALHIGVEVAAPYESLLPVLEANPDAAKVIDLRQFTVLHLCMIHNRNVDLVVRVFNLFPGACLKTDANDMTPIDHIMNHGTTRERKNLLIQLGVEPEQLNKRLDSMNRQARWRDVKDDDERDVLEKYDIMLDVESENPNRPLGWNPLHRAMCKRASAEETDILIRYHPKAASQQDNNKRHPLHVAMRNAVSVETLALVFRAHPNAVHVQDFLHRTPLDLGEQFNAPDELFDCMLQRMTEISGTGRSRLHLAMSRHCTDSTIRALLADNPRAVFRKDSAGQTPLHVGIRERVPVDIILNMISLHPQVASVVDGSDRSPLHLMASFLHHPDLAHVLIRAFPRACTIPDGDGKIPLHWALEYNAPFPIIRILLEYNPYAVQIDVDNDDHWTALHLALLHHASVETIELIIRTFPDLVLMKRSASRSIPLHLAMQHDASVDVVDAILNHSGDDQLDVTNFEGSTALHVGVACGASSDVIARLLRRGPQLKVQLDRDLNCPLHLAMKNLASMDVIGLLLDDKTARMTNRQRATPMHLGAVSRAPVPLLRAVMRGRPAICSMQDNRGNTAMFNLLEQLYQFGNRPTTSDSTEDGNTGDRTHVESPAETTEFIREMFNADPETADTINYMGASPITILLSQCINSQDWATLQQSHAVQRLKILLQNQKDARRLRPLFSFDNPTSLRAFIHIIQDQQDGGADDVMNLDLNLQFRPDWTLLEILADFDTPDAASMLLQLIHHQRASPAEEVSISGVSNGNTTSTSGDRTFRFSFGGKPASRRTLTEVARRSRISTSSEDLSRWGQVFGRFLETYRIEEDEDPLHVSESCIIIVATELRKGKETRVVLKFMTSQDVFQQEVRRRIGMDGKYVVPIKAMYSKSGGCDFDTSHVAVTKFGIDIADHLSTYPKIHLKAPGTGGIGEMTKATATLDHLIVMEYGYGGDLHKLIDTQNIAGKDAPAAMAIAKNVALSLKYLNETKGIMHGDVKARNFVARDGHDFAVIDLDTAVSIKERESSFDKNTSSGCIPPEAAVGRIDRGTVLRASLSQDMWSFGVLLYQLCTGRTLFNVDTQDNIEHDEMQQLIDWTDDTKEKKLSLVKPGWPRTLINSLLDKDPHRRPRDWNIVLESLNYTGKFDRLFVFQAQPLVYRNEESKEMEQLPLLNCKGEREALDNALAQSDIPGDIEISYEPATWNRICEFLSEGRGRILHLSCHGDPEYLALEDGNGGIHKIYVPKFKAEIEKTLGRENNARLDLVFLSACNSQQCAEAIFQAGVPHVICCKQDYGLHDGSSIKFAGRFYRELALGKTVKEAFQVATNEVATGTLEGAQQEASKYHLLSRDSNSDVFFTAECPAWKFQVSIRGLNDPRIPVEVNHFVGREKELYDLIRAIKNNDVVKVQAKRSGIGKSSFVAAACRYMLWRRKDMTLGNVIWLSGEDSPDTYYNDPWVDIKDLLRFRLARATSSSIASDGESKADLQQATGVDEVVDEAKLLERSQRALAGRKNLIVVDMAGVDINSPILTDFLGDLFQQNAGATITKAILINQQPVDGKKKSNVRRSSRWMEDTFTIKRLDYDHTVKLFGYHTLNKLTDARCTLQEFVTLFDSQDKKTLKDLYIELGQGIPERIIKRSKAMSPESLVDLLQRLQ